MPDFSAQSKFDANKNYTEVKFGAGAPLLEVELNELQQIQNYARAELIRQTVPSGVIDIRPNNPSKAIDTVNNGKGVLGIPAPSEFSVSANLLTLTGFNAVINGNIIYVNKFNGNTGNKDNIPDRNEIILPPPPAFGTRDDLVFLEAWFEEIDSTKDTAIKDSRIGQETSRRIKLNWQIRTVADVNFNTYDEGVNDANKVKAWGGTGADTTYTFTKDSVDVGLYKAGDGSQTAKDTLKTADGYVYAIPLFRVKRRNNAGYRADNLNGALNYKTLPQVINFTGTLNVGDSQTITVTDGTRWKVGEVYTHPSNTTWELVITAVNGNQVTIYNKQGQSHTSCSTLWYLKSDRPDGKYANIIDKDDIIDLRHQVSLTGFNYQKLLEENFDKLLRGELQTKDKPVMKKERFNLVPAPLGLKQELVPVTVVGNDGVTRDLVNLLGSMKDTLFLWTAVSSATPSTDEDVSRGTVLKVTSSASTNGYGAGAASKVIDVDPNKYYLVLMDLKNGTAGDVSMFILDGSSKSTVTLGSNTPVQTTADWKTHYIKISPSLLNGLTKIKVYARGYFTGNGQTLYADALRIYEIDQATYDLIDVDPEFTGEKLAQKFPYVDSYPNFVENLLPPFTEWTQVGDTGAILSPYKFQLDATNWDQHCFVKIPLIKGQQYTFSVIGRGRLGLDIIDKNDTYIVNNISGDNMIIITFTPSVDGEHKIKLKNGSQTGSFIFENPMLTLGSIAYPFVPYGRWFLPYDYASGQVPTNFTRFNEHRGIVSDAQTSVTRTDIVEALKTPQSHIKVTQAIEGQWNKGDTIQITSNEGVITGVIDADTALTRILETTSLTQPTVKVSSTNGLNVGDQFIIYSSDMRAYWTNVIGEILSVDIVNSTITVKRLDNEPVTLTNGDWLFEINSSTSAPVVTATGIAGTWSGLGTKTATFTITAPPTNRTDPIKIDYSISYPAGQGISEVPMEVYEARVNGERLVKASDNIVRVKANFEGKTRANKDLIPHTIYPSTDSQLSDPITLINNNIEVDDSSYKNVSKVDNTALSISSYLNGGIAKVLFSFDLIRLMEDKFGHGFFADCVTTADKVNKLKSVIKKITCNWWGYGSSPTGNKATIQTWNVEGSKWTNSDSTNVHTSSTVTKAVFKIVPGSVPSHIDSNGFVHFLAYAKPSDGTTASTINTDYVELEVEINVEEAGYDVLVPENPFPKLSDNILTSNQAFPVDLADLLAYNSATISIDDVGVVKVVTNGAGNQEGIRILNGKGKSGTYYTASVYVKGNAGATLKLHLSDGSQFKETTFTADGTWQKVTVTHKTTSTSLYFYVLTNGTQATTFYVKQAKVVEDVTIKSWTPGRKKKNVLNFLGKVAGSTLENKNKLYNKFDTTFGAPSTFTNEQSQTAYDNISKQDGTLNMLTTKFIGHYTQELYEFDLSVLGLSLSELKKALRKITVTWVGYGKGGNAGVATYGATMKVWNRQSNDWRTNPMNGSFQNTTSTPSAISNAITSVTEYITNDQKLYVLVHSTYPAGTSSDSELYTDYIKLEVELADYVDYVKSNVVKVRKETKEVKLQYPAKSYRSGILDAVELWYKYVPYQGNNKTSRTGLKPLARPLVILTSLGTGGINPNGKLHIGDFSVRSIYSKVPMTPFTNNLPLRSVDFDYQLVQQSILKGYSNTFNVLLNTDMLNVGVSWDKLLSFGLYPALLAYIDADVPSTRGSSGGLYSMWAAYNNIHFKLPAKVRAGTYQLSVIFPVAINNEIMLFVASRLVTVTEDSESITVLISGYSTKTNQIWATDLYRLLNSPLDKGV